MGAEFSMVIAVIVYLGVLIFGIYLILRFIRSIESIAASVKRIADRYETK